MLRVIIPSQMLTFSTIILWNLTAAIEQPNDTIEPLEARGECYLPCTYYSKLLSPRFLPLFCHTPHSMISISPLSDDNPPITALASNLKQYSVSLFMHVFVIEFLVVFSLRKTFVHGVIIFV